MRYFPLILVALIIDALQSTMGIALLALAFGAGPVGGGAAGAAACSALGSAASQACAAAGAIVGTLFSPAVTAAAIPLAAAVGFALSIAVTICAGAFLITLIWLSGVMSGRVLLGFAGEMIPGANYLPFWTAAVVATILKKRAEERGGTKVSGTLRVSGTSTAPAAVPTQSLAVAAAGSLPTPGPQAGPRPKTVSSVPFTDVRPKVANDNLRQKTAYAA